jgi:hypothetical protein
MHIEVSQNGIERGVCVCVCARVHMWACACLWEETFSTQNICLDKISVLYHHYATVVIVLNIYCLYKLYMKYCLYLSVIYVSVGSYF